MTRFPFALAATLSSLLLAATAAHAISQARLWGTIKDENAKPVAGVKITVTLPEVASFKVEEKSNEKGEYAITLVDATRTYTYTFEKDGYQSTVQSFKVAIGTNERRDFEVVTLAEAKRRGPQGRELTPQDRAVLIFNEGAEAAQMGDTATARAKFEEALTLDANLVPAYTAVATLEFGSNNWAKAAELAEKAHALDANDTKALKILTEAYHQLGDETRAKAAAEQLLALDPKSGAGDVFNQGIREYNAGNTDAARVLFEKTLEVDSDYAKAHYMLGLCLAGSEPAKAKEHFETFLRLAPGDPDAPTAQEMVKYLK